MDPNMFETNLESKSPPGQTLLIKSGCAEHAELTGRLTLHARTPDYIGGSREMPLSVRRAEVTSCDFTSGPGEEKDQSCTCAGYWQVVHLIH